MREYLLLKVLAAERAWFERVKRARERGCAQSERARWGSERPEKEWCRAGPAKS